MPNINDYAPIVGQTVVDELKYLGERLRGKIVQNVNSTRAGGGVAEILHRMIPLISEVGVDMRWDVIEGNPAFFDVTKKFHNALHGVDVTFKKKDFEVFLETTDMNLKKMDLHGDIMFIHDPQPIGLINKRRELGKDWVWRCHIDFTSPHPELWEFLKDFINKYNCCIFSAPRFSRPLDIPQFLIAPSIDPLADKNRELSDALITSIMDRLNIPTDKPIITQISRFDYLKDPFGVIDAFKIAKKRVPCRLVLAGSGATDDPEGEKVLNEVYEKADNDPDVHILLMPPDSNIEINAIQRASTIVLQKSLKEGFGLTVSEGLWKAKPMIVSPVGGIPLQVAHGYSGVYSHTIEGTAYWIKRLLENPDYSKQLGIHGKEHIRNNFLITRHIRDYLLLFLNIQYKNQDVVDLK